MKEEEIFRHYIRVGDMLARLFPDFLEIIIHDLRTPEKSIIAIYNGHVTGRKVGDATSDVGFKRLTGEVPDDMYNYANESPTGDRMKSSSIAIRDGKNKLIGSFSLNLSVTYFDQIKQFLDSFTSAEQPSFLEQKENFLFQNPKDEIRHLINQFLIANNMAGLALSNAQKRTVVEHLWDQGHFNKRSAVSIVSSVLKITRPTVYSYIKARSKALENKASEE